MINKLHYVLKIYNWYKKVIHMFHDKFFFCLVGNSYFDSK